ncbi:hypothetical protein QQP08_016557 [Theobroma cacao]|nr:hypothetical protein QQP08_016557 [Theobroma cacao]
MGPRDLFLFSLAAKAPPPVRGPLSSCVQTFACPPHQYSSSFAGFRSHFFFSGSSPSKMNCFPCFSSQRSKKETGKKEHDSPYDALVQSRVPGMPCALLLIFPTTSLINMFIHFIPYWRKHGTRGNLAWLLG